MRIIGGKYRGKRLAMPDPAITRPMTDRIKETIFNRLEHAFLKEGISRLRGGKVLDAFGGTGALGLEALSRGAGDVTILELSRQAYKIIQENAAFIQEQNTLHIRLGDATQPPQTTQAADLIFVAPPYEKGLVAPTLTALVAQGWVDADTLLVIEIAAREILELPPEFSVMDSKSYATARILYAHHTQS